MRAGHATVGYALGGSVEAIQLDGENEVTGAKIFWGMQDFLATLNGEINTQHQMEILTVLAGPAAELVYRGEPITLGAVATLETRSEYGLEVAAARRCKSPRSIRADEQNHRPVERGDQRRAMLVRCRVTRRCTAYEYLEEDQVEEILAFWMHR